MLVHVWIPPLLAAMQTAQACPHVGPLIRRFGMTAWQGLCLHLLLERARGFKSSWYPYLALLPTELEMVELHPLMWPPVLTCHSTFLWSSVTALFWCTLIGCFSHLTLNARACARNGWQDHPCSQEWSKGFLSASMFLTCNVSFVSHLFLISFGYDLKSWKCSAIKNSKCQSLLFLFLFGLLGALNRALCSMVSERTMRSCLQLVQKESFQA